jgi:hypothetical protein
MDSTHPAFVYGFVKQCRALGLDEDATVAAFATHDLQANLNDPDFARGFRKAAAGGNLLQGIKDLGMGLATKAKGAWDGASTAQRGALVGGVAGGAAGLLSKKNKIRNALLGALLGGGAGYGAGRWHQSRQPVDVAPEAFEGGGMSSAQFGNTRLGGPGGQFTRGKQKLPGFSDTVGATDTKLPTQMPATPDRLSDVSGYKPTAPGTRLKSLRSTAADPASELGTRLWAMKELKSAVPDRAPVKSNLIGAAIEGAQAPGKALGDVVVAGQEGVGKAVDAAGKALEGGVQTVADVGGHVAHEVSTGARTNRTTELRNRLMTELNTLTANPSIAEQNPVEAERIMKRIQELEAVIK